MEALATARPHTQAKPSNARAGSGRQEGKDNAPYGLRLSKDRAPIYEYDTSVYGLIELRTEKLAPNYRQAVRNGKQDYDLKNKTPLHCHQLANFCRGYHNGFVKLLIVLVSRGIRRCFAHRSWLYSRCRSSDRGDEHRSDSIEDIALALAKYPVKLARAPEAPAASQSTCPSQPRTGGTYPSHYAFLWCGHDRRPCRPRLALSSRYCVPRHRQTVSACDWDHSYSAGGHIITIIIGTLGAGRSRHPGQRNLLCGAIRLVKF